MKTTIITITDADDIYSIQDKLTWNKSGRVLLKLVGNNPLFLSKKEMALLLRSSKNSGAQIGLVSQSRAIKNAAKRSGIPVFVSQQEAMQKGWAERIDSTLIINDEKRLANLKTIHQYERKKEKELSIVLRLSIFLVAVFAVISLVAFFIPSAKVTLHVNVEQQVADIPIQGEASLITIDLSGTIPIQVKQLELSLSDQSNCSGTSEVPVSKASGNVLIQNLTDDELIVPAHTIFSSSSTPDIRFESIEEAVLTAGVNETIQIEIAALKPGIDGNVAEETIDAVEGALGLFVTVTNMEEFSGGENLKSGTPTTTDLFTLRRQIKSKFNALAAEQFAAEALSNEIFVPGSINIIEIRDERIEPEIGQPSEVLNISQDVLIEGWFINKGHIKQILTTVMDIQLEPNEQALDDVIEYDMDAIPRITDDEFIWMFPARRSIVQAVDIDTINRELVGKPINEAMKIIKDEGFSSAQLEIKIFPSWWQRMPFLENNIEVQIIE
ncbi:MAG: baseplate J/gp47 family protein [Anaerolineaceae bacterium]|nr:baseplate J/gp47 family protein [Anaerolineaceae bacterium]